jgi:hypothetical protein
MQPPPAAIVKSIVDAITTTSMATFRAVVVRVLSSAVAVSPVQWTEIVCQRFALSGRNPSKRNADCLKKLGTLGGL